MAWSFDRGAYDRRMEWYVNARFGLFLHWGLYAIPAQGEWVRSEECIPNEQYDPLMAEFNPKARDMRQWMAAAKAAGRDKPEYGRLTRKGDKLYIHIFENTVGPLPLFGVDRNRIRSVRRLADGSEAPISASWVHSDYPGLAFADLGPDPVLPDPVDTVLEVRLK